MEDSNPTCCSDSRRGGILLVIHVPAQQQCYVYSMKITSSSKCMVIELTI